MTSEQELNEKLAEWAGWELSSCQCHGCHWHPKGSCGTAPDFTKSLDSCYEWLLPKLTRTVVELSTDYRVKDLHNYGAIFSGKYHAKLAIYFVDTKEWTFFDSIEENQALALCRAIEKMIDKVRSSFKLWGDRGCLDDFSR